MKPTKLTLSVNLESAQFDRDPEAQLAKILERTGKRIEEGEVFGKIFDYAGNVIGVFEVDTDELRQFRGARP